jgi:hypothetical protein
MRGRNARQCRDRWCNFLSPNIVNSAWSNEAEKLLRHVFRTFGNAWKQISRFFPGRTEINVKSHWQVMQCRLKREFGDADQARVASERKPWDIPPEPEVVSLEEIWGRDFDLWLEF